MIRIFRRRRRNGNNDKLEIQKSEQRLKDAQQQWPKVYDAQSRLERMIQQALKGGKA